MAYSILKAPFVTLLALCYSVKHASCKFLAKTSLQGPNLSFNQKQCCNPQRTSSALTDETNACAKSWEMVSMKFKGVSDLFKHLYLCLGNFLCHENKTDTLPKKNQVLGQIKYLKKKIKNQKVSNITNKVNHVYIATDERILHVQNDVWQPWQKEIIPTAVSIASTGVCHK